MLSYIVRITVDYQTEHGYSPNTLILSKQHLTKLEHEYVDVSLQGILKQLGLDILLVEDSGHPRVSWFDKARTKVAAANY